MRKRAIDTLSHAKWRRSKIRRRGRFPRLPVLGGGGAASIHVIDAEDEGESSASCFHGVLSTDNVAGFTTTQVLKLPPRAAKAKKPIGVLPRDGFRRITRSYTKQQERLRSTEKKAKERAIAKNTEPQTSEGSISHEIAVSGVSHVSAEFNDEKHNQKAGSIDKPQASGRNDVRLEAALVSRRSCDGDLNPKKAAPCKNVPEISETPNPTASSPWLTQSPSTAAPYDPDLISSLSCTARLSSEEEEDDWSYRYSTCDELMASEWSGGDSTPPPRSHSSSS